MPRADVDAACEHLHREVFEEPRRYSGVHVLVIARLLSEMEGWRWHAVTELGKSPCRAHPDRLPAGALIVFFKPTADYQHCSAIVDGVVRDVMNCTDPRFNLSSCVVGYFAKELR